MRRADRLFQLVQILRNKRLVTARELAERLEVSERTIYRDIQDFELVGRASGRGSGCRLPLALFARHSTTYVHRCRNRSPRSRGADAESLGWHRTGQQCAIRPRQGSCSHPCRIALPSGNRQSCSPRASACAKTLKPHWMCAVVPSPGNTIYILPTSGRTARPAHVRLNQTAWPVFLGECVDADRLV